MAKRAEIYDVIHENVSMRAVLAAIATALLGLGFMGASFVDPVAKQPFWAALLVNVGALLVGTVAIAVLWELGAKRAFARELSLRMQRAVQATVARVQLPDQIEDAGLMEVRVCGGNELPWADYFESAKELDVFVTYGATWRNNNVEALTDLAKRGKVRIFLPDYRSEAVLAELENRSEQNVEVIEANIKEAIDAYHALARHGGNVEIRLVRVTPLVSLYRFDDKAVVASYSQRRARTKVPTFVCTAGSAMYEWVEAEINELSKEGPRSELLKAPKTVPVAAGTAAPTRAKTTPDKPETKR